MTVSRRPQRRKAVVYQLRDFLLLQRLVEHREGQSGRQDFRQHGAADRRLVARHLVTLLAVDHFDFTNAHGHLGVQFDEAVVVGAAHFVHVGEHHAFALAVDLRTGGVVKTEHDVLRRHDDRLAIGWRQHIVGRQHQGAGFHLRFERQRDVHGHLVAVEVGVERHADQRVQLNRLAFDQHRLESLDAETVQRRRTVQHDRMFADHLFEDVPHFRHFLSRPASWRP
jgi:hypothetical protein